MRGLGFQGAGLEACIAGWACSWVGVSGWGYARGLVHLDLCALTACVCVCLCVPVCLCVCVFLCDTYEGEQDLLRVSGGAAHACRQRCSNVRSLMPLYGKCTRALTFENMRAADGKGQLHTVHAGVKMFEKNPTKNEIFDYRLRQEGVPFLLPWLTKRVCPV